MESVHTTDEEDNTPPTNDVGSLKTQGIIKTSNDKAHIPYTILLVGGSGVGKSSFVEFIANALLGRKFNNYNLNVVKDSSEKGSSGKQKEANEVRRYEFTARNGRTVRILDTPGFPNKRDTQHDEFQKSIATQIKDHTDSVTAVLIFTNGTVPRDTGDLPYALSILSAVFPNNINTGQAKNTALMLTNVANPLSCNFSQAALPGVLARARQFQIDNPVALQRRYLNVRGDPRMGNTLANMLDEVKTSEENALDMLEDLFDWLDGLELQPTAGRQMQSGSENVQKRVLNVKGTFTGESKHLLRFMPL